MRTGIIFKWGCDSKNAAAIKALKAAGIAYQYDHFGRLTADFYGVGTYLIIKYVLIKKDMFEIYC